MERNCPKHVAFYSKNKSQELLHLVGFIVRIYRDARSPERQMRCKLHIQYFESQPEYGFQKPKHVAMLSYIVYIIKFC